ncbi:hypothetical protein [Flindersiella endophytica]
MTTFDPWSTPTAGRPSRTPLIIGGAVVGLVIIALIAAFAWPREPEATVACGVVVDSTSFSTLEVNGENVERGLIEDNLPSAIESAGCEQVRFGVVHGSPSIPCLTKEISFVAPDSYSPTQKKQHKEKQSKLAIREALEMAGVSGKPACAQDQTDDNNGSAVVDTLREITDPDKRQLSMLVVLSDFDENKAFKLTPDKVVEPGWRRDTIADLEAKGRLPQLEGTTVTFCGIGVGITQATKRLEEFKTFWRDLLEQSGANDVTFCEA